LILPRSLPLKNSSGADQSKDLAVFSGACTKPFHGFFAAAEIDRIKRLARKTATEKIAIRFKGFALIFTIPSFPLIIPKSKIRIPNSKIPSLLF
jgi:hypothetical protein